MVTKGLFKKFSYREITSSSIRRFRIGGLLALRDGGRISDGGFTVAPPDLRFELCGPVLVGCFRCLGGMISVGLSNGGYGEVRIRDFGKHGNSNVKRRVSDIRRRASKAGC